MFRLRRDQCADGGGSTGYRCRQRANAARATPLRAAAAVAGFVAATLPLSAYAGSGFELRSQSATTLGTALSGMTAGAADLTTMIFNPAALAYGIGTDGAIVVTGLVTSARFAGSAATTVLGNPIPGNQGGNSGTEVAVPNLYVATDVTNNVRFGVAIASRFGLGSYWESGWVGRYYALDNELTTFDIVPTLSYRASPALSFGIGIDLEYAKIKTSSAIDFGTIDQVLTGGAFGGVPAGSDGSTSANADSWGVGVVVGVIYEPRPGTRLGFDYHSPIRQRLRGDASFDTGGPVGQGIALVSGAFSNTSVSSTLDMPATAAIGIYHQINSAWAVMADVKWSGWSALETLEISFGNPAQAPVQTVFNWRDSWFAAVGTRFAVNDRMGLRFGAAYDQSPTRDETRNPILADSDSYWASVGMEYRFSPRLKMDLAYGHVFAKDASINLKSSDPANVFRGNLAGTIHDSHVDYLTVQFVYRF